MKINQIFFAMTISEQTQFLLATYRIPVDNPQLTILVGTEKDIVAWERLNNINCVNAIDIQYYPTEDAAFDDPVFNEEQNFYVAMGAQSWTKK